MKRDDDRDPVYVRACELYGELTTEMLAPFNFKLILVEDGVAARAAAILVTRIRELNRSNNINDQETAAVCEPTDTTESRLSDLLQRKRR